MARPMETMMEDIPTNDSNIDVYTTERFFSYMTSFLSDARDWLKTKCFIAFGY